MTTLWNVVLVSGVSWAVGKVLDAITDCSNCNQKNSQRIINHSWNQLHCINCHNQNQQFTNACNNTVSSSGVIGGVSLSLSKQWQTTIDPYDKSILRKKKWDDFIFVPYVARTIALANKDLVVKAVLSDYNTKEEFATNESIFTPPYYDTVYGQRKPSRIFLNWKKIPAEKRDKRIFAIDTIVKSRYGDKLTEDRILTNIWK